MPVGNLKNDIETRKSKLDKIDKLEDKKISLVAEACDDGGLISFEMINVQIRRRLVMTFNDRLID